MAWIFGPLIHIVYELLQHKGRILSPDLNCCLLLSWMWSPVRARSGLPSELLYADDLVLMAPIMEQLGRRVAEWRASLLDNGW